MLEANMNVPGKVSAGGIVVGVFLTLLFVMSQQSLGFKEGVVSRCLDTASLTESCGFQKWGVHMNPDNCPECDSLATKLQLRERYGDEIIEVRTCDNCPTEYEVNFGDPHIAEVRTYAD